MWTWGWYKIQRRVTIIANGRWTTFTNHWWHVSLNSILFHCFQIKIFIVPRFTTWDIRRWVLTKNSTWWILIILRLRTRPTSYFAFFDESSDRKEYDRTNLPLNQTIGLDLNSKYIRQAREKKNVTNSIRNARKFIETLVGFEIEKSDRNWSENKSEYRNNLVNQTIRRAATSVCTRQMCVSICAR